MKGTDLSNKVQKALSADNQSTLLVMSVASHLSQGVAITVQSGFASRSAWYWSEASVCVCVFFTKRCQQTPVLKIPQAGSFPAPQTMKATAEQRKISWLELKKTLLLVMDSSRGKRRTCKETFLPHLSALNLKIWIFFHISAAKTTTVTYSCFPKDLASV